MRLRQCSAGDSASEVVHVSNCDEHCIHIALQPWRIFVAANVSLSSSLPQQKMKTKKPHKSWQEAF
jgi:hypothetical protein